MLLHSFYASAIQSVVTFGRSLDVVVEAEVIPMTVLVEHRQVRCSFARRAAST